jgi:hypothetical protein
MAEIAMANDDFRRINKRVNCKHYHGTMVQLITVKLGMGFSVSFVLF